MPIRVIAVFIRVENFSLIVHPAVPVGGGAEFHFAGVGVDGLILAAEEEVILKTDFGVSAAAVLQDPVIHLDLVVFELPAPYGKEEDHEEDVATHERPPLGGWFTLAQRKEALF